MANFFSFLTLSACIFASILIVISAPVEDETNNNTMKVYNQEIADSIRLFGINMFQHLNKDSGGNENILVSPLNAYYALLMVHLGATEKTRNGLSEVMKLSKNINDYTKLHEVFGEITKKIEYKSTDPELTYSETLLANGIFVQKNLSIHDAYVQQLKKYYNGNITNLDFSTPEATDTVNSWISEKTKERISKFYSSPIDPSTIAILVSALYFNAQWKHLFSVKNTKPEKFNTGLAEIEVPTMQNQELVNYYGDDDLQCDMIELPYAGDEYFMKIILPRSSQSINNLTEHLHLLDKEKIRNQTKKVLVDYKIPKMKFSWKESLVKALKLQDVFASADLSLMTPGSASISDMRQATEIEVDEKGTIATAVTIIQLTRSSFIESRMENPIPFYVDRPFLMTIIHKPTQIALFGGKVHQPMK